ncbi:MAG: hypothetical protein WCG83_04695 [Candidatus Peregrinibacteria bacterium]
MYSPQHKNCLVDGCTTPTHGKSYCRIHIKDRVKNMVITTEQRSHMRSDCCGALCTEGVQHEYGKQYCGKCKNGCVWAPGTAVMRAA